MKIFEYIGGLIAIGIIAGFVFYCITNMIPKSPKFYAGDCARNYYEQFDKEPLHDIQVMAVGHKLYNLGGKALGNLIEHIDGTYYKISCKESIL